MSDVRIRDEIAEIIDRCIVIEDMETDCRDRSYSCSLTGYENAADRILSIPRIKEALAFHESCQKAFEVNGEFVVTRENVTGKGGVAAS